MKFEGPVPETETRQVSLSFAAFIVAVAVVLFGIAMTVGTMTPNQQTDAPSSEAVSAEQALSEAIPTVLPAVTQPDADADSNNADAQDDTVNQSDAKPEPQAPPQQATAVAQEPEGDSTTASATDPGETRDPSFPARHTATPSTTAPAAAATPKRPIA